MGILTSLFSSGIGTTIEAIGSTVKKFVTTDNDRMQMQKELEAILQKRDSEVEQTIRKELEARERIMVAEMQQSDNYTKRARPTVVYFGLFAIFFNYMLVPLLQSVTTAQIQPFPLPAEFWLAWGGVVGVYSIGRSMEKRGDRSKVTNFITGSEKL